MKKSAIIVGAGAAGLMAARELAKEGIEVTILEARKRIGGRIWPLSESDFGYFAQGGAEFTHGSIPITKALLKEAGLTYVPLPNDAEMWGVRDGQVIQIIGGPLQDTNFVPYQSVVKEKLSLLTKDISIGEFLKKHFAGDEYSSLRNWVIGMVHAYDLADIDRMNVFSLRDEWLGGGEWEQGRIKEGYGALLTFLKNECESLEVKILLDHEVASVRLNDGGVLVTCRNGTTYDASTTIITVPLPVISNIRIISPVPQKIKAVSDIGFGGTIKLLLRFVDRWWEHALGRNFSKLTFMLTEGKVTAWWTQYPGKVPVLTGWIPDPIAQEFLHFSDNEILKVALASLAHTFAVDQEALKKQLKTHHIVNWPADPFAQGAYSYPTLQSEQAREELVQPVHGKLFFAGEALCSGKDTATVEGALGSGQEVTQKVLKYIT